MKNKSKGYWTKEKCLKVSRMCKTRKEFYSKYNSAYKLCLSNGWTEAFEHMTEIKRPHKYWFIKENCLKAALECKTRSEFGKKYFTAYIKCIKNDWYEAFDHMIELKKPSGYWNSKENCINAALECKTRSEFRKKYPTAYIKCIKNDWYEAFFHMYKEYKERKVRCDITWTKERCLEVAKECKTRSEFQKKYPTAYTKCHKNLWYEAFEHMI
jgi:hypothetical protein